MFVQQADLQTAAGTESGDRITINIDPLQQYQTIVGFGGSFTDSSAYLINQKLSEETRNDIMIKLFDPEEGIGLSFIRNPMGASDFARTIYSYDDVKPGETDFALEHFSIDHDRDDIIPLTKEAMRLNPDLTVMASPWSPPGWMKTSGGMLGGSLREDCYDVYGDYFIRFLEAYRAEGIEIYAITPQNEPLFVPPHYPGCNMPADKQADFINKSLGPKLKNSSFDTKLLCYDHNWDRPDFPEAVFKEASEYVDGVAWHVYNGDVSAQSQVVEAFPDKETFFTEASGGEWVPPFEDAFIGELMTGINVLNNHSRSYVLWNMALDEENGPVVPGFGRSTCRVHTPGRHSRSGGMQGQRVVDRLSQPGWPTSDYRFCQYR
ncbi:glucosylceramidase [Holotrichia oblita]|uniref:Glucosylceramidase n=1 Tax=Holotrichia oblita TaxID=644536 RepID=A0ACB9T4I7_HOLOL|nr:glucosylceramidase [Holotrichia oblita]